MKDGKHVVLYVEDDRDFLESIRLVLESSGYIVESAVSGEQGLAKFRELRPDLILVDMMMEEVDAGLGLVKALRLEGNTAPVFMLSSVGDQLSFSVDTSELGLAGVFQKPVKFEQMLATFRSKLG